jgi:hypothetical protein
VKGWKKSKKSMNVEGGFFLWRLEFFKIGKHDFTFIGEMRVTELSNFRWAKAHPAHLLTASLLYI